MTLHKQNSNTIVFIDTQNVHLGIQSCGRTLDWEKFIIFLKDKFKASKICMFLGYLPEYGWFYEKLKALGYTLYFKTITRSKNNIKGNENYTHSLIQKDLSFNSLYKWQH